MPGLKIRIQSQRRSGNHFLFALLWENFVLPPNLAMRSSAGELQDPKYLWGGKVHLPGRDGKCRVPLGKLFGTHSRAHKCKIPKKKVLYIFRHPVPRAISEWRFVSPDGSRPWQEFINPHTMTAWMEHVRSYLAPGWAVVRYEDLLRDRNRVLPWIEEIFGLERKHDTWRGVPHTVGWQPRQTPVQPKTILPEMMRVAGDVIPEGFAGYSYKEIPIRVY
jgi:hypothetical protein